MANHQKAIAAWQQKNGSNKPLFLSLPSSKEGEYLMGISLVNNSLIIAHECPASKRNKPCWHVEAAHQAYKEWLWWQDLSGVNVIRLNQKIKLGADWEQIPIPGEPISFGLRKEERINAS